MTIKPTMDCNNAYTYSNDVISPFNSSPPPSTMQNNNGRINHHLTNNEMITYHNHKMNVAPNPMMSGESQRDEDAVSLSIEEINELDKDLAEIMNDLHIPYEMKQDRSQTEYSGFNDGGSTNNSQTITVAGTNITNNNSRNNNNNNNNMPKKMRKKKRKKSKHKLEKEGVSYDPPKHIRAQGNVQISKNLTENIIPSRIAEPISDIYRYMDKLTALNCIYNDMTLEINNNNNENIMILNYGFHDKETNKMLYCIAEKQDISNNKSRGYKWRIMNRLFTDSEIENEYHISSDLLPKTFNQSFHFKSLLNYQLNVEKLLLSDSIRTNMINNCPWHKIEIYRRTNNKRRLTLSLTKPEFMKSMQHCTRSQLAETTRCGDNNNNINLIPVLMFDNDQCQYLIEFVWIIEIEPEIDIGISFKYIANNDSLKVTGIHLDAQFIENQHQLIDPHHDCRCLDSFKTRINMMAIGNPDDNINKIKYYKQQIDELQLYKENLIELLTTSDNNRRDQVIQALIQKTGIGNKQQVQSQRMMINQQQQQQQQYNRTINNMPQTRQSPQPMMNNMNRYPVNHCQVQPRPHPQPQPMMTGNHNNHVNYHNNMNMNANVNANVSSNTQYRNTNNNNNNNSNNQNLFNPIYNGWQGSPVQISSMYPKQ